MASDTEIKNMLLMMSQQQPEDPILYSGRNNNLQDYTNHSRQHNDVCQWTTNTKHTSSDSIINKSRQLRIAERSFLPRLDLKHFIRDSPIDPQALQFPQSYREIPNYALLKDSSTTPNEIKHKRSSSINQIQYKKQKNHIQYAKQTGSPISRCNNILMDISLPKTSRAYNDKNREKFSKYSIASNSLDNSIKRAKRRIMCLKSQYQQLECNSIVDLHLENNKSRPRLLNDQLSHYLSQLNDRSQQNRRYNLNGSQNNRVSPLKHRHLRRIKNSDIINMDPPSLEIRNGPSVNIIY